MRGSSLCIFAVVGCRFRKTLKTSRLYAPREHTLKVRMIDSGLVFQKFVVNTGGLKTAAEKSNGAFHSPVTNQGGLKPSYLGPPQSNRL